MRAVSHVLIALGFFVSGAVCSAAPLDLGSFRIRVSTRLPAAVLAQKPVEPVQSAPGLIVISTRERMLYHTDSSGEVHSYEIGVGRQGFQWAGTTHIAKKVEWPDWTPPQEMLLRQPWLPHFMAGGPHNPLGARALYLGQSLYRIHGSNDPKSVGQDVTSGCFRMHNDDVIDLYRRVRVGTKVIVLQ